MNELVVQDGATVVYAYNPLDAEQRKVFRAGAGLSIRQLRPITKLPVVVMWNGQYVLSEDEDYIPQVGDHLVYFHLPLGGGNASQAILGAILIVVGVFFVPAYIGVGLLAAGVGLLVVGLTPAPKPNTPLQSSASASPTYNIDLAGNSARIGQSIPVLYGRHVILPDFAAQPYIEYDDAGDQYYHALMCIGQLRTSQFTIESIQIADTDISHFVDVEYNIANGFLPDGVPGPSPFPRAIVNPAVVTNTAVANNVMDYGTVVGPFAANGPGLKSNFIGVDFICPKGLYFAADDGSLTPITVHFQVEGRTIDDYNNPTGTWVLLGSHALTGANTTPIRRSYKYTVATGRYEVRASRLEAENTDSRYGDTIQWAGLRSYLDIAPNVPLNITAQYIQLRIKADAQLSGLSQRQVSLVIQRWLPTWNPDTGWSDPVYTRSPAWVAADILRNTDYSRGVPDSRIDLQSLFELDQVWSSRGDTCDIVFDTRTTIWAALQAVLATGRAKPIMRGNVFTFVRDQEADLPVALFNMRNIVKNSFKVSFSMLNEDSADGVEVQFFNEQTWSNDYVTIPVPGVEESLEPAQFTIVGITNRLQAQREASYLVASSAYRRTSISFDTEMEGYIPCFGDLIAVSHDLMTWGTSGEFESWDGTTAGVTEDLTWTGNDYLIITDVVGDVHGPYKVVPAGIERSLHFVDAIDPDLIYTGTELERTRFSFGAGTNYAKNCKITSLTPNGDDIVSVNCVVEDNRVHTYDAPYTGSGSVGGGTGGGGSIPGATHLFILADPADAALQYDSASDAQRAANGFLGNPDFTVGTAHDPGYALS